MRALHGVETVAALKVFVNKLFRIPSFVVGGRTLCLEDDNGRCRATGDDEAGQARLRLLQLFRS